MVHIVLPGGACVPVGGEAGSNGDGGGGGGDGGDAPGDAAALVLGRAYVDDVFVSRKQWRLALVAGDGGDSGDADAPLWLEVRPGEPRRRRRAGAPLCVPPAAPCERWGAAPTPRAPAPPPCPTEARWSAPTARL
jgi:hypothetical protein